MTKPVLFLDHDAPTTLKKFVSGSASCGAFTTLFGADDRPWFEQICDNQDIALAIIYLTSINQQIADEVLNSHLFDHIEVVFISNGEPNPAIENLVAESGCFHFREPIDFEILEETLEDFCEEIRTRTSPSKTVESSHLDQFGLLLGSSKKMHHLFRLLRKVADSEANVFIDGESGSGKELVANTIHIASPRCESPFIAINCGALSPELVESELFGHVKGAFTGATKDKEGYFKQAENGTLFLDEVTEMPLEHQVKLLRVLESGEYRPVGSDALHHANVRVIAASNRDPKQAIEDGFLREDLYFRLAQFPVSLPPLRERDNDKVGLALHFIAHRNLQEQTAKEIDQSALDKINSHDWPGNVRELRHVIERAFILSDHTIQAEHVIVDTFHNDKSHSTSIEPGIKLAELEKEAIEKTLEANQGNRGETAEQLGISVKTLYNKLEKYQQVED